MSKNIDPVKIRAFIKATKETSKDDNKNPHLKKKVVGMRILIWQFNFS